MSPGPRTNDSIIVAAFRPAMLHQSLVVLVLLAVARVTLNLLHTQQFRRALGDERPPAPRRAGS